MKLGAGGGEILEVLKEEEGRGAIMSLLVPKAAAGKKSHIVSMQPA